MLWVSAPATTSTVLIAVFTFTCPRSSLPCGDRLLGDTHDRRRMDASERPKSDHDVGDAVLRVVAATLAAHCRRPDLVDRQGGEEFVAVFDDADADDALIAAERL